MTLPQTSWDAHIHLPQPVVPALPPAEIAGHLVKASPATNFVLCMSINDTPNAFEEFVAVLIALNEMKRKARGTVILPPSQMDSARLRTLHVQGVRSVRIHVVKVALEHGPSLEHVERVIEDTAKAIHEEGLEWTIDGQFSLSTWSQLHPLIERLHREYGTIFVADHIFCAGPDAGSSEDFERCLELVEKGMTVVKVTALEKYAPDALEKFQPMVEKLLRCREGTMLLWGSDWPHVDIEGNAAKVDINAQLGMLMSVCESAGQGYWEKLTRENASRIYA